MEALSVQSIYLFLHTLRLADTTAPPPFQIGIKLLLHNAIDLLVFHHLHITSDLRTAHMRGMRWNYKLLNISLLLDQLMIKPHSKGHITPVVFIITSLPPSLFPKAQEMKLGSSKLCLIRLYLCEQYRLRLLQMVGTIKLKLQPYCRGGNKNKRYTKINVHMFLCFSTH